MRCQDCGTLLRSSGACPNCQEELVIFDEQMGEDPVPVSQAFMDKVDEQRELLKAKKNP